MVLKVVEKQDCEISDQTPNDEYRALKRRVPCSGVINLYLSMTSISTVFQGYQHSTQHVLPGTCLKGNSQLLASVT